jgi:hypothetical protein
LGVRYFNIGNYQVSIVLLLMIAVSSTVAFGATYYLWTRKTIIISVEEPLTITVIPSSVHFHPGENQTLAITVQNSATANYSMSLTFALNDTDYQRSYVQFSNYTYNIVPGVNDILAWVFVAREAPAGWHELAVDFYRQ